MKLIKKIKSFLFEINYPQNFAKSLELESLGKLEEALTLLNRYEDFIKKNTVLDLDYFLIRSRLFYRIGNFEKAILDANIILENLKYLDNDSEINFLYKKKYLYLLLSNIYYKLNNKEWEKYYELFESIDNNIIIDKRLNSLYHFWFPILKP